MYKYTTLSSSSFERHEKPKLKILSKPKNDLVWEGRLGSASNEGMEGELNLGN